MYKYINNNPLNGLLLDYKLIGKDLQKMLKKCHAPSGLYNPANIPYDKCNWDVLMSERSSSKTTQILLYWMCAFKRYGVKIVYLRKSSNMITQSMYVRLFDVINNPEYGYIDYLTDGKYNNIVVDRTTKHCYYVKTDDNGKEVERSAVPFMVLWSVDQYDRYASTFNSVDFDSIIFDEFSWGSYAPDEFLHLCQIIATVRRERSSVRITMLSNTITPYNQYLRELGISGHLAKMKKGDKAIITSALGTKVYCELLDVGIHNTVEFSQKALSYFGFENEALRSLYGGEWEIKGYKHLPPSDTRKINPTKILLCYMGNYMRLSTFHDGKAVGVIIAPYTREVKEYHIIVTDTPDYNNINTELRAKQIITRLHNLDCQGFLYFADNETGLQWSALRGSLLSNIPI